jgi:adenylosuccinate lyase
LIPRYTRPEMGRIWSDENRFRNWLKVEVAATETLAEAGMVPKAAAKAIRERADFQRGANSRNRSRSAPRRDRLSPRP